MKKKKADLVDIEAVAERLGVNVRAIRQLVAERAVPHYKIGQRLRFDPDEVEEWLQERKVEPVNYRATSLARMRRRRSS